MRNAVFLVFCRFPAGADHTGLPHHGTGGGIFCHVIRLHPIHLHFAKEKVKDCPKGFGAVALTPEFLGQHVGKRAGIVTFVEAQGLNDTDQFVRIPQSDAEAVAPALPIPAQRLLDGGDGLGNIPVGLEKHVFGHFRAAADSLEIQRNIRPGQLPQTQPGCV